MNVAPCYVFKLSESGSHSSKCALVNPTGFVPAFQATLPASTRLYVLKMEGKTKQGSIRQPSFFRIPNSLQCRLNFKGSWGGDATQHSFSLIIVGHTNYPRGWEGSEEFVQSNLNISIGISLCPLVLKLWNQHMKIGGLFLVAKIAVYTTLLQMICVYIFFLASTMYFNTEDG